MGVNSLSAGSGFLQPARYVPALSMILLVLMVVGAGAMDKPAGSAGQASLRRFAVSSCLAEAYKGRDVAVDALAAAGGYFETGTMSGERYVSVQEYAEKWVREKKYQSKHGANLSIMICLDLYDDPGLLGIIKEEVPGQ